MPITDVLQMMGRAGRPQYDNMGIALIMVKIKNLNKLLILYVETYNISFLGS